jgi:hypothetical protein
MCSWQMSDLQSTTQNWCQCLCVVIFSPLLHPWENCVAKIYPSTEAMCFSFYTSMQYSQSLFRRTVFDSKSSTKDEKTNHLKIISGREQKDRIASRALNNCRDFCTTESFDAYELQDNTLC